MEAIPLHRVAVVKPFTNFLAAVGAPFERGFRQAGLPVCALEDANNFIPSHRFWEFLVDMAFSQDIPDLGFRVGQRYGANCADPHLIDLLRRSPTLYQGLLRASALINETVSHCKVGVYQPPHSQFAYFYHSPSCDARNPVIEQLGWYGILPFIGMVREFAGYGVDIMLFGDDVGTQNGMMFSPAVWREFFKERLRTQIADRDVVAAAVPARDRRPPQGQSSRL